MVNPKVWRCMDETALIALGILIEESAREISGDTGDLVFTEGVEVEDEEFAKRNAQEQTPTVELRDGGKVTCHSDNEGTASSSDGDGAETDDEDG